MLSTKPEEVYIQEDGTLIGEKEYERVFLPDYNKK